MWGTEVVSIMSDSRLDHERIYRDHAESLEEKYGDHTTAMQQAVEGSSMPSARWSLTYSYPSGFPLTDS